MTVYAAWPWKDNASLIAYGALPLGYLAADWPTLDVTYGLGNWWTIFTPNHLEAHDLRTTGVDFTNLPTEWDGRWKVVALDAPYKLNGRSTWKVDHRYGVEKYMSVKDRMTQMQSGLRNCARVVEVEGYVLAKCQDQVCGGKVHWQTQWYIDAARESGLVLVDRLDIVKEGRPQPPRTRKDGKPSQQQHARRNGSALMVFQKPRPKRRRKVAA